MIDTDKYEGHSMAWGLDPDDWTWAMNMFTAAGKTNEVDALLIQDAPLLLAEVKRLRKGIIDIADKWEQPSIIRGFLKELKEMIE